MSAAATDADVPQKPRKGLKGPILAGLALAILGGAGGAGAVMFGLLDGGAGGGESHGAGTSSHDGSGHGAAPIGDVAFVPMEPILVNLPPGASRNYLSFTATLEVRPDAAAEVESVLPRVTDVLNTYFRALDPADLEDPAFITRTRGQLLRRIRVVAGEDRVRDILVIEFVLN